MGSPPSNDCQLKKDFFYHRILYNSLRESLQFNVKRYDHFFPFPEAKTVIAIAADAALSHAYNDDISIMLAVILYYLHSPSP